ncbi:Transcription factor bHLH36 like [Actinidia chinensis var. chinensis]|uniref:Transcription factor bHLH36 like n=1 Tax=Actinidia chinensis var. chinensis TaxID=1590841 RepID=A0A2R6QC47_ACTCC|nr:Transcription factor bHLH36 like [Actinidia chinensis var. chinensis]
MVSCQSSSTPKIERRLVEKNRRNHMKSLYSNLYSLLPNHVTKKVVPLPHQIDEVVSYIRSLQTKLEKSKERKETLSGTRKKLRACINESIPSLPSPKIEIHEMGYALNVTLVTGYDDKFLFHEIIRLIQEEGAEVLNANFSAVGNSIFHAVHAKAGEFMPNLIVERVSSRLKEFVNGYVCDSEESIPAESWEFELQPDQLDFEIPQVLAMAV